MIQHASVPSLLSFWDEHFLHSWFDTQFEPAKASVSSGLAVDLVANALPQPQVIAVSDAISSNIDLTREGGNSQTQTIAV